jgi:hypothetical protein
MKSWKSKLFGDNNLNFYGWIITGLSVIAGSLFVALSALFCKNTTMMLLAIYLVLIGIFCLQLQNYHSRIAEKLDKLNDGE